jgi:glycosyltransferase involved in cell wall biosynthesis
LYLEILRRADVVLVTGTQTARYLTSRGVAADRIRLLSAKVDVRRFRPVPDVRRDYDLIFAGRLVPLKRVDLFLRIVADLKARRPSVRAAILGDGPLRGELEQLADRLGVGGEVEWLGFQEDTERYYRRARVFVLTSTTEGLSLAMLEAMACGLPAVAPAVGDLADVVQNGVTGYLVPSQDQEAFVTALSDLLDDEERLHQLGDNARSAVLGGYSLEDGARCWHTVVPSAFCNSL